jgi:hypothetical protein
MIYNISGGKDMREIIPFLIVGLLVLSGIGAGANLEKIGPASPQKKYSDTVLFSEPLIKENDKETDYLTIDLKESNANLQNTGEPILPTLTKTYTFPFGTTIKDVQVVFSGIKQYPLLKRVTPTPAPVSESSLVEQIKENEAIYTSHTLYPKGQYTYSLHAGLEKRTHVIIMNLQCFPIHYIPADNLLEAAEKVTINVTYTLPDKSIVFPDKYDMVIIAPEKFSTALQPLIDHKNSLGIKTTLKTTESIYSEFSGRDQPEKIKYFIKYGIENWNISYVLLVGGKKSLLFGNWGLDGALTSNDKLWYVPVRYSNLLGLDEACGFLTDLYYADIYKVQGNITVFDDWDSNGNGIFSEWNLDAKDILDLYPDVYVGRLPCENTFEVKLMVQKIIQYEKTAADPSWFNRIIVAGGDSFDDRPPLGQDYYEGEEMGKLAISYMSGFTPVRLWASYRESDPHHTPTTRNILREMNNGSGFLYFSGHGSPLLWDTHWVHDYSWNDTPGGLNIYQMVRLHNGEKLPICLIAACHNNEFNISFFDFLKNPFLVVPTPECWGWWLTRKIGGGSIATIGYTGVEWCATYGWDNDSIPDCTEYFSGYLDSRFFHAYGIEGIHTLGDAWGQAITEYLDVFPGMKHAWDCKTVQEFILFGDPSLLIGGYA